MPSTALSSQDMSLQQTQPAKSTDSNGLLIDVCPVEIVNKIMGYFTVADAMLYAGTNVCNYVVINRYLRQRLTSVLSTYVGKPSKFLEELKGWKAVVSGSLALKFFEGEAAWECHDMDLYVPKTARNTVMQYLKDMEGYTEVPGDKRAGHVYEADVVVTEVVVMKKDVKRIDIVVSGNHMAVAPVFQFHTTTVMNFISGDGFFSAYPQLTGLKRGLTSTNHYNLFNSITPDTNKVACYLKYVERGYDLQITPHAWDVENGIRHKCGVDSIYPHTIHNSSDAACLFWRIWDNEESVELVDIVNQQRYYEGGIIWYLGGRSCTGDHHILTPFSSIVGSSVL